MISSPIFISTAGDFDFDSQLKITLHFAQMRYFENKLPDLAPGSRVHIDVNYWRQVILSTAKVITERMPPTFGNCDGGLYVGCGGLAYMFYYLAQSELLSDVKQDLLTRARNYSDVALSYSHGKRSRDPPASFLLGAGGVYAVSSLVYNDVGQKEASDELNKKYKALASVCEPVNYLDCGSDELFVGRAGYLCGTLLLNRKFGEVVPKQAIHTICKAVIHSGLHYARHHKSPSPLMYAYYNTEYLGAAHGLSAILQMLLSCPSYLQSDADVEKVVHGAVDFMLAITQTNGNIAPAMDEVESLSRGIKMRPDSEELIHWCHGAPGVVYLFAKAFLYWKDEKYLQACLRCGEITWQKGLLKKGPGICHGVAGSGYVFLLLYRLTSDERHLHRALKFAEFMQSQEFTSGARTPDSPYSLYEGLAGSLCFLTDLMQPQKAEFPFFNVFG